MKGLELNDQLGATVQSALSYIGTLTILFESIWDGFGLIRVHIKLKGEISHLTEPVSVGRKPGVTCLFLQQINNLISLFSFVSTSRSKRQYMPGCLSTLQGYKYRCCVRRVRQV
jgi:ribosome-interacting GTPase 1